MLSKLTKQAVKELERMLPDSDPRIRLRAASIILRHSDKVKAVQPADDTLTETLNNIVKNLELELGVKK